VIPVVPPVKSRQLMATIWSRNNIAIVAITNEWPRRRVAIAPRTSAKSAAINPAAGSQTNGEPPTRVARMPTV
jgi:hypothetical protein